MIALLLKAAAKDVARQAWLKLYAELWKRSRDPQNDERIKRIWTDHLEPLYRELSSHPSVKRMLPQDPQTQAFLKAFRDRYLKKVDT